MVHLMNILLIFALKDRLALETPARLRGFTTAIRALMSMAAPKLLVGEFPIALDTFVDLSFVFMFLDDVGFHTTRVSAAPVAVRTFVVLHCFRVRMCVSNVGPHFTHLVELFVAKRTSVNGSDFLNIVNLVISGGKQRLVIIVIIRFLLFDCHAGSHS